MPMTFDDNTTHNSDTTITLPQESEQAAAPAGEQETPSPTAESAEKPGMAEDFATALETFTNETEALASEERILKGTVLKITPTHVVVDIGAKSEGMLPIAEVQDHEGKVKFQAGDAIDVMREKGETEEGYINLS